MLRRMVTLILFMVLPLQALASVHMALCSVRHQAVEHHVSPADDGTGSHSVDEHHAHGKAIGGMKHGCSSCDLCIPPLGAHIGWATNAPGAIAVAPPEFSSAGIIPRSFDRPPRSDSPA